MLTSSRQNQANSLTSIGILIVNTGTPTAPTTAAVRQFLAQFLADSYVINYPRWLWLPLLYGIILRVRPRRSARLYQRIWTQTGSPLLLSTQCLAQKLESTLVPQFNVPLHVITGMRYGEPSIPMALRQLHRQEVGRILVLPLFPQYSGTTTGTVLAAVFNELQTWPFIPGLTIISDYHDHRAYIRALAGNIRANMMDRSSLLFSFHGIPRSYGEAGDLYESQCQRTADLLAKELDLEPEGWSLAFQSRFGPQEWLTPYTNEQLAHYGRNKLPRLNVVCPGFAVDCLETLDEIAREGAQTFQGSGGGEFNYIPALNDGSAHVEALSELILSYLC